MRGGEKALEVFCEMFPAADLFTLVHLPGTTSPTIERRTVKRSAIQWLPFPGRLYREYLPLFPIAVEQFDLDGYDLVISTSHCAVKSVVVTGRARHLCYCLTPMRYAWDQFDAYFGVMAPLLGTLAGRRDDYRYLAASVAHLPPATNLVRLLAEAGFEHPQAQPLLGGTVTVFTARRFR